MLKKIKRLLLRHRIAALGQSLTVASAPILVAGAILLVLLKVGWLGVSERLAMLLTLGLAALVWIPWYVRVRGSILSVARTADAVLGAGGMVTAGADMATAGHPRSPWGALIEEHALKALASGRTRNVVPWTRFACFLVPLAALMAFALTWSHVTVGTGAMVLTWNEKDTVGTEISIFNAVDEKMLAKLQEKLKEDLEGAGASNDPRLKALKKEMLTTLSTVPKSDEQLAEYIAKVEKLKKKIEDIQKENAAEQAIMQAIGKKMDGKLLDELGQKLEEKNLEEAAQSAKDLAEKMENAPPADKDLEEAAQDLKEGTEEGGKKLEDAKEAQAGDETKESKEAGAQEGQEQGEAKNGAKEEKGTKGEAGKEGEEKAGGQQAGKEGEPKSGGNKDGQGMDAEKFDKLKKTLEKLNKLAEMFNIKSPDQIPDSLKDLAKEFSDSDINDKQAKELKDLIDKLDNLKNMMVEAKEGEGKGKYNDLAKQFEDKASGGKPGQQGGMKGQKGGEKGQPGQKGQGQAGATPEGKQMMPGQGEGESGEKGESGGGGKPQDGKGKPGGPEKPGDGGAAQLPPDDKKSGQEGWGNGSAPHLGDPTAGDPDAAYDDMDVEGKDSPGPLKKDIIKGAAEKGFVGKDYKDVYEEYSSIIEEILEDENVPSLYRYYVNKYFELISPRSPDSTPP
jgi:hypothetical protein